MKKKKKEEEEYKLPFENRREMIFHKMNGGGLSKGSTNDGTKVSRG